MLTLEKLRLYLDELLPGKGVADYAPNGLQVEGKSVIGLIATAVSSSLETIEAAAARGVDALIVHHGLFWQRDSYCIQGVKKKKLALLMKHEISLFAYHLPLDLHPVVGNNWKAAKDMGWQELQPFGDYNGVCIGVKGRVPSCSPENFKERLENYYLHPAVYAAGGPKLIQTAALISGGAHKSIVEAAQVGVDAFITGSYDEPTWHQAKEEGVHFYAMGHSATERVGPQALACQLEEVFHLPCPFIDIANPF